MSDLDLPRNLKLDTTGDLDLSTGNLQIIGGLTSLEQDVRQLFKSFEGEWFLDRAAGIPYFQSVLRKNPNPNLLQAVFRRKLLARPGIISIDSLEFTRDPAARRLFVDARMNSDEGDLRVRSAL